MASRVGSAFLASIVLAACGGRVVPGGAPDAEVAPDAGADDGTCANDDCHDGVCSPTLVASAPARGDGLAIGSDRRLIFGLSFVNQTSENAGFYSVDRCGTEDARRFFPTPVSFIDVRNEGSAVLLLQTPMAHDAGAGSVSVMRDGKRFTADARTTPEAPLLAFDGSALLWDDVDDGRTHATSVSTRADRVLPTTFFRAVSDGARWYGFSGTGRLTSTDLDGGDAQLLGADAYADVRDLTHDDDALYWITFGTASLDGPLDGHVYREAKDGGAVLDLFDGRRVGNDVVVDATSAYFCSNGWLYRVPKLGGGATVIYRGDVASADACFALAVDETYLYWIDTLSVLRLRKTW